MTFKASQFSKCMYNPMSDTFWLESDRLQELGTERTMKYVIIMYDPNSPVRREYPDFGGRKVVAEDLAGFYVGADLESGAIKEEEIIKAIIGYLKIVNSRLWAMISSIEAAIWEMNEKLLLPVTIVGAGADKDKLAAVNMKNATATNLVEMNATLDSLLNRFYDNDADLQEKATEKPMSYSAESIAKAMKK